MFLMWRKHKMRGRTNFWRQLNALLSLFLSKPIIGKINICVFLPYCHVADALRGVLVLFWNGGDAFWIHALVKVKLQNAQWGCLCWSRTPDRLGTGHRAWLPIRCEAFEDVQFRHLNGWKSKYSIVVASSNIVCVWLLKHSSWFNICTWLFGFLCFHTILPCLEQNTE